MRTCYNFVYQPEDQIERESHMYFVQRLARALRALQSDRMNAYLGMVSVLLILILALALA